MAKTGKVFTMQGIGCPVSAAGQGEQAGPQASSSCDRSSSAVGNLAIGESYASRKTKLNPSYTQRASNSCHSCDTDKNHFCYICGKYEVTKLIRPFNTSTQEIFKSAYNSGNNIEAVTYAPEIICNSCRCSLYRWNKSKKDEDLKVITPMVWNEPTSRENCYFCMTEKDHVINKSFMKYPRNSSSILAVLRQDLINQDQSVQEQSEILDMEVDEIQDDRMDIDREFEGELLEAITAYTSEEEEISGDDEEKDDEDFQDLATAKSKEPEVFSQEELNDLIRELGLPKDGAEFLASRLKNKNLLDKKVKVTFYRKREEHFRQFFTNEDSVVYCRNIKGLMDALKPNIYRDDEWRLFIDSSKSSLKAVLLHNTNKFACVPVAYSKVHKEEYGNLKMILQKLDYDQHNWQLCGDLKILTILLGQQSGYTKNPCYLCLWDSRDRENHFKKKNWEKRKTLTIGKNNIVAEALVSPSKVLISPLHIKLGLMKQFVKSLNNSENIVAGRENKCFKYLEKKFPKVSDAKLREGVFDGPQIRALMRDEHFIQSMIAREKKAWMSFKDVCKNFLGNNKHPDYKKKVRTMVSNFKNQNCMMNLKLHFLDSHLENFPENLGDYSEEHGERFHQDFKEMEERYQGNWDVNMMADYCWCLKRDVSSSPSKKRKRLPMRRSFEDKQHRYHKKAKHLE